MPAGGLALADSPAALAPATAAASSPDPRQATGADGGSRVSEVEPSNEPDLTGFSEPQSFNGKPYRIDMLQTC